MNKTTSSRVLSVILCLALLAAVALTAWGCTTNKNNGTEVPHTESSTIESSVGATDTGEDTEDSTEAETAAPMDTAEPSETNGSLTNPPATENQNGESETAPTQSGCSSVVSVSVALPLLALAAYAVSRKKREE